MKRLIPVFKLLAAGMVLTLSGLFLFAYFNLHRIVAEVKHPVAAFYNPLLRENIPPGFKAYGISNGRSFSIRVNDSITLSACEVPAQGAVRGTIVALHGYRSNKNRFLPAAAYFSPNGWNFIAVDLRAHNQSSGHLTGFSFYERQDIDRFLDSLAARNLIRRPLVLYGHSIGAATAVFVASRRKDVDALILESCFDDFRNIIPNYTDFYAGMDAPGSLTDEIFERLHIPPSALAPVDVAGDIHIPVLQVQGSADRKVLPGQARGFFEQLGTNQKQWLLIQGGTHNRLWLSGTKEYFDKLNSFLQNIKKK